jgi:hypothetical protein
MSRADAPSTADPNNRPRGGNGKFAASIDTAERDAAAAQMRVESKSYQQIADALGFADKGAAHHAVDRALKAVVREPAEALQKLMRARLDEMRVVARDIMLEEHYAHSAGRLIFTPTGEDGKSVPMVDRAPNLAAVDRLVKIEERAAKLDGLDAAVKFENLSLEAVQAQIAKLEAEAAEAHGDGATGSP